MDDLWMIWIFAKLCRDKWFRMPSLRRLHRRHGLRGLLCLPQIWIDQLMAARKSDQNDTSENQIKMTLQKIGSK